MNLRQLEYFVRIAEAGSFRGAAKTVNVAQSALSRHVRELEEELSLRLFQRTSRGVVMTAAGERLYQRSTAILHELETTRIELMSEGTTPRGMVTIGASSTTSRLLYGRLVEAAEQQLPLVTMTMLEGASYFLLEGLDTGRIDLALMVNPEPRDNLHVETLVREPVYLIGSSDHKPDMPREPCTVTDLAGLPLVLFSRPSGSRAAWEAAAARKGVSLHVRFEAASPDVAKDLVGRGLGYGLMPHSSIYQDVEAGSLKAVSCEGLELTRTIVLRADRPLSPAIKAVVALVRDQFAELEKEGIFGRPPGH